MPKPGKLRRNKNNGNKKLTRCGASDGSAIRAPFGQRSDHVLKVPSGSGL